MLKIDIDQSAEILRLRATVRDLLALSIIPEAWVAREPNAIAAELADLLIGSLKLDFAFVRLCDPIGCQAVEVIRGHGWKGFPEWLQQRFVRFGPVSRTEIVTNVGGAEKSCCGVVIPIGVNSERGLIAAACDRSDFPSQIDQQLLSVAANNAATAFQNARLINELRTAQKTLRDQEHELRKARDELEIKVAERTSELRKSEKELRDAVDTIPALVWSALPDGSNTYANKRFVEYLGLSAEHTAGSRWQALIHPDDLERHASEWMEAVATGKPHENESRYRRSDGQYRWHLDRGMPLRDEDGNIVKWYGVTTDIEDRKRAEEALRRAEQELQQLVDFVPQHIVVLDPGGRLIHTNRVAREYTGLTLEEFQSLDVRGMVIHPDDLKKMRAARERGLAGSDPFELDARQLGKDGIYRWFLWRYNPLVEEGRVRRWYVSATEIESRKQEEERVRQENVRLEERTRIAQELHDTLLQNFLSASMQLGATVDGVPSDSPVKVRLDRILQVMEQGIEDGRKALQGLRLSDTAPLDLVQAFSGIQRELAVPSDVEFRVTVIGEERPLHLCIQHEIYRIGREALINVFRHSGATRVEVELEYADRELRMRVRDNGCGLDPRVLDAGREGHWGLSGMRERAAKIGGLLKISSSATGTEIELSLPLM